MARKSKNQPHSDLIAIENWQKADQLLMEIGASALKIKVAEAKANNAINKVKGRLQKITDPILADILLKTDSLNAFCENHKEDFAGQKSRKLRYGTVGWRFSSKIIAGQKCIAKIKVFFGDIAATYLHIKEEPNKEALEKLDDASLKAVGVKRKSGDSFFVEPGQP